MRFLSAVFAFAATLACTAPARSSDAPMSNFCEHALLPTSELISYLEHLLDERILNLRDLALFVENYDQGALTNPLPSIPSGAAVLVHRRNLEHLLQNASQPEEIIAWARASLQAGQSVRESRESTSAQTRYRQLHFIRIPGGRADDETGELVDVPAFEISDTLITQAMWIQALGQNPAANSQPNSDDTYDHPVENVTWWSMVAYANAVSVRAGLEPAYSTEKIAWSDGTSAASGTLKPKSASQRLGSKISKRDVRQLEGYRLPTFAEMQLLLDRYVKSTHLSFENASDFFWASPQGSQPVASTPQSFVAEGQPLHDLLGNVDLVLHTWGAFGFSPILLGSEAIFYTVDSVMKRQTEAFPLRGADPGFPLPTQGLRLVRTILPEGDTP